MSPYTSSDYRTIGLQMHNWVQAIEKAAYEWTNNLCQCKNCEADRCERLL